MELKKCPKCGKKKNRETEFGKRMERGRPSVQSYCKKCVKEINKEVRSNKHQYKKLRASIRNSNKKLRIETMEAYGGKCVCCGETRWEFLTIHHKYNDGAEERRLLNLTGGTKFYRWLKKANYPQNRYECLCYNCNCAKGVCGYCPHEKEGKPL